MAKEQYFAHPPRGHVAILAYDDVNNRWQVLECTADGYLKTRLQEVNGTVLVQQVMPSLLQPGINTYIGTAWQKQPPIWGYTDRLAVTLAHTKVGGGDYTMEMLEVPEGYIYKIDAIMSLNTVTAVKTRHRLYDGSSDYDIAEALAQPATTWLITTPVTYILKHLDKVKITWFAAVNNDVLHGRVWGSKMAINL